MVFTGSSIICKTLLFTQDILLRKYTCGCQLGNYRVLASCLQSVNCDAKRQVWVCIPNNLRYTLSLIAGVCTYNVSLQMKKLAILLNFLKHVDAQNVPFSPFLHHFFVAMWSLVFCNWAGNGLFVYFCLFSERRRKLRAFLLHVSLQDGSW